MNRKEIELGSQLTLVAVDLEGYHVKVINIAPYTYTFLDIDNHSRLSDRCLFTFDESHDAAGLFDKAAHKALKRAGFVVDFDGS